MLAATIAVGGFIGVPGMIFVVGASSLVASATELVVAFSMGLIGSIKWGMMGLIDIRLTVIILAGSLFGVQIGAYGTTFVNQNYIKKVMGTIMLLVALSRGIIIPNYLSELELITINDSINIFLKDLSYENFEDNSHGLMHVFNCSDIILYSYRFELDGKYTLLMLGLDRHKDW